MKLVSLQSLLAVSTLGIVFVMAACTTEDDGDGNDGSGGQSNATGGATNGTGGSTDSCSDPQGAENAVACPAPTEALMTDFTYDAATAESENEATFGDFEETFSGGTFVYPNSGDYELMSDVTGDNWHITGDVGEYSGFGMYLANDCSLFDASAFSGLEFTISGDTGGRQVTLHVGTAGNEISSTWATENEEATAAPNFGRCEPGANRYDGTCSAPSFAFDVPETPTKIQVAWSDLTGGSPQASVNSCELTYFSWSLEPPAGVDTESVTPYAVELIIDDLAFIP